MKRYDLTTKDGFKNAASIIAEPPIFWLFRIIFERAVPSHEEQRKTAEELIKAGKENGVDEMEITISKGVEGKINVPMDDVKIDVGASIGDKVTVKVKYK